VNPFQVVPAASHGEPTAVVEGCRPAPVPGHPGRHRAGRLSRAGCHRSPTGNEPSTSHDGTACRSPKPLAGSGAPVGNTASRARARAGVL